MTTKSIDIWGSAQLLMVEHGERAPEIVSRHIAELTAQGDAKGAAEWSDIMAAIASLRSRQTPPRTTAH